MPPAINKKTEILLSLLEEFPDTDHSQRRSTKIDLDAVRPFLQWVGGKREMVEQYSKCFPDSYNTYYEPFLGGGAIFFYLLPKKAVLGDNNPELITTFEAVRDCPKEVVALLKKMKDKHSEKLYYSIRTIDREHNLFHDLTKTEVAARMIYLNQTCFNAVYRVNKKGQFNVPIGSSLNRLICDETAIMNASKILKNMKILCTDFEETLKTCGKDDFVYLDPPYEPISRYSDFTRYTKEKFFQADQIRLKGVFSALTKKGCKIMLSNSDCEFVRNLYKDYRIVTVYSSRNLNCKKEKRGQVTELLILNY